MKTSMSFAALSSETVIIFRKSPSRYEPRAGRPECRASVVTAIASFSVDAAGKRARAFQAAPSPLVRLWT